MMVRMMTTMVTPCTCWGARTFCGRYKDKNRDNAGDDDSDVENVDDGEDDDDDDEDDEDDGDDDEDDGDDDEDDGGEDDDDTLMGARGGVAG